MENSTKRSGQFMCEELAQQSESSVIMSVSSSSPDNEVNFIDIEQSQELESKTQKDIPAKPQCTECNGNEAGVTSAERCKKDHESEHSGEERSKRHNYSSGGLMTREEGVHMMEETAETENVPGFLLFRIGKVGIFVILALCLYIGLLASLFYAFGPFADEDSSNTESRK